MNNTMKVPSSISPCNSYLNQKVGQQSRQIRDPYQLFNIKEGVREAFYRLKTAKSETLGNNSFQVLGTGPDQDLANIPAHLKLTEPMAVVSYRTTVRNAADQISPYLAVPKEARQGSYAQLIWNLKWELQKYPGLTDTEVALLLVESLMNSEGDAEYPARPPYVRQSLIGAVWAKVLDRPVTGWDEEIMHTGIEVFAKLLKNCFGSCGQEEQPDFSLASSFFKTVQKSLSVYARDEWILRCAKEIEKLPEDMLGVSSALKMFGATDNVVKGVKNDQKGVIQAPTKKVEKLPVLVDQGPIDVQKVLKKDKIETREKELDSILDELERGAICNYEIWNKALEKVVICRFDKVKQKACTLWFRQYKTVENYGLCEKAWLHAASLLKYADPEIGFKFICDLDFVDVMALFAEKQPLVLASFYENVFRSAIRHQVNTLIIQNHQESLYRYPSLRNFSTFELAGQALGTLNRSNKVTSLPLLFMQYVRMHSKDGDKRIIQKIHSWILLQLDPKNRKGKDLIRVVDLARAVLEKWDEQPGVIECSDMAKLLKDLKIEGSRILALKFAFKGCITRAQDKNIATTLKYQKLDEYFELMTKLTLSIGEDISMAVSESADKRRKEEEFWDLIGSADFQKVLALCTSMPKEWWEISKGRNFLQAVGSLTASIRHPISLGCDNESTKNRLLTLCEVWKILKKIKEDPKLAAQMIEMALSLLPLTAKEIDDEKTKDFKLACKSLCDVFSDPLDVTRKVAVENRPIDLMIQRLCEEMIINFGQMRFYLIEACKVVKVVDNYRNCVENGSAEKVLKSGFQAMFKPGMPILLNDELVDLFINFMYKKEMHSKLHEILAADNDNMRLAIMMALHLYPESKIQTIISNQEMLREHFPGLCYNMSKRLDSIKYQAEMLWDVKTINILTKLRIWESHLIFLESNINLFPEHLAVQMTDILKELLELLIAKGIKNNEILQEDLEMFSYGCETALPRVYNMLKKVSQDKPKFESSVLDLLFTMAELKIPYAVSKLKADSFKTLINAVMGRDLDFRHLDWLIHLGMSTDQDVPAFVYTSSKGVKSAITSTLATIVRPGAFLHNQNLRSSVNRLFAISLARSKENKSLNDLVFTSKLLKTVPFVCHRKYGDYSELLKIFSDCIRCSDLFEPVELLKTQFFENVFYALSNSRTAPMEDQKPGTLSIGYWKTIECIKDLVGTYDEEAENDLKVLVKDLVDVFFAKYEAADKEDYVKFNLTRRISVMVKFNEFLSTCRKLQYLEDDYIHVCKEKVGNYMIHSITKKN